MGGSTVRIVWPGDGTSEIQNLEHCNFLSILFCFVGGTLLELRSGETSARRQQVEYVEDDQNVE